jgi:hypothetical protein
VRAPLHNHGTTQCEMFKTWSHLAVTTSLLQCGEACGRPNGVPLVAGEFDGQEIVKYSLNSWHATPHGR